MSVFSHRNGYNINSMKLEYVSEALKGRIFAVFYKQEFDIYDTLNFSSYTTGIENMMIQMGIPYEFPENRIVKTRNAKKLESYVLKNDKWYLIFDFIERYLSICDEDVKDEMIRNFNKILEDESSAYRILEDMIVPITNKMELDTIIETISCDYEAVKKHMTKAVELFSERKNPDYENSIKESISAVEAMCCIITGLDGGNATLGKAIKKLKDKGVYIHSAMESAFSSLYGYTSDENGIRHGGIDFKSVPSEDAKYMLISCSAFVNYLIEKWSKVK